MAMKESVEAKAVRIAAAEAIMVFALENYEAGWDTVVECWDVEGIYREMVSANLWSYKTTLKHFTKLVKRWKEKESNCW